MKQSKQNVVLYCRTATNEEYNLGAIDELEYQKGLLKEYCEQKGYTVSMVFKEFASGNNFNRREWKALARFINNETNKVDKVVFTEWSRLSRNCNKSLVKIREYKAKGIEFEASTQPLAVTEAEMLLMLATCTLKVEREFSKSKRRNIKNRKDGTVK